MGRTLIINIPAVNAFQARLLIALAAHTTPKSLYDVVEGELQYDSVQPQHRQAAQDLVDFKFLTRSGYGAAFRPYKYAITPAGRDLARQAEAELRRRNLPFTAEVRHRRSA